MIKLQVFPWSEITGAATSPFISALTHEPVHGAVQGAASEKPYWICTEKIFQVKFLSNKVTIFTPSFRFKAQQAYHHNLKVLYMI